MGSESIGDVLRRVLVPTLSFQGGVGGSHNAVLKSEVTDSQRLSLCGQMYGRAMVVIHVRWG